MAKSSASNGIWTVSNVLGVLHYLFIHCCYHYCFDDGLIFSHLDAFCIIIIMIFPWNEKKMKRDRISEQKRSYVNEWRNVQMKRESTWDFLPKARFGHRVTLRKPVKLVDEKKNRRATVSSFLRLPPSISVSMPWNAVIFISAAIKYALFSMCSILIFWHIRKNNFLYKTNIFKTIWEKKNHR